MTDKVHVAIHKVYNAVVLLGIAIVWTLISYGIISS